MLQFLSPPAVQTKRSNGWKHTLAHQHTSVSRSFKLGVRLQVTCVVAYTPRARDM